MIHTRLQRDSVLLYRGRRMYRELLAAMYRDQGTMYGQHYDALETANIRELAELSGIPMGYGRVTRTPTQLHGYEGPRAEGVRASWDYWDPNTADIVDE